MLLRHSLNLESEAAAIESAVAQAIADGIRTIHIADFPDTAASTTEFGRAVAQRLVSPQPVAP